MPPAIYLFTNESLEAIIAGLDINEDDDILAVCGSGDQAIAILEFAKKVKVVDIEPKSLQFLKERVELLRQGEYNKFLNLGCEDKEKNPHLKKRNDYFHEEDRLNRIRLRLDKLDILPVNDFVSSVRTQNGITKIYLSNVYIDSDSSGNALRIITPVLPLNGLIYATSRGIHRCPEWKKSPPPNLYLDQVLTDKATKIENSAAYNSMSWWNPRVYRKIN